MIRSRRRKWEMDDDGFLRWLHGQTEHLLGHLLYIPVIIHGTASSVWDAHPCLSSLEPWLVHRRGLNRLVSVCAAALVDIGSLNDEYRLAGRRSVKIDIRHKQALRTAVR